MYDGSYNSAQDKGNSSVHVSKRLKPENYRIRKPMSLVYFEDTRMDNSDGYQNLGYQKLYQNNGWNNGSDNSPNYTNGIEYISNVPMYSPKMVARCSINSVSGDSDSSTASRKRRIYCTPTLFVPDVPPRDALLPTELMTDITLEELIVYFPSHVLCWPGLALLLRRTKWNQHKVYQRSLWHRTRNQYPQARPPQLVSPKSRKCYQRSPQP
jgi:hypothetical protein